MVTIAPNNILKEFGIGCFIFGLLVFLNQGPFFLLKALVHIDFGTLPFQ